MMRVIYFLFSILSSQVLFAATAPKVIVDCGDLPEMKVADEGDFFTLSFFMVKSGETISIDKLTKFLKVDTSTWPRGASYTVTIKFPKRVQSQNTCHFSAHATVPVTFSCGNALPATVTFVNTIFGTTLSETATSLLFAKLQPRKYSLSL
jgi:hypothetical protein